MKTLFLKNGMPVAAAVLAIAGAFATTSMQSSSSTLAPVIGYTLRLDGECDIAMLCNDVPNEICRISYPNGAPTYRKDFWGDCTIVAYRHYQ